jgi:hypothetical protein
MAFVSHGCSTSTGCSGFHRTGAIGDHVTITAVPGAELDVVDVVDGTDHALAMTHAGKVADAIAAFVRRHRADGASSVRSR